MQTRIIEIAENNRLLSVFRGFLIIEDTNGIKNELARIPLDDIHAVIVNAYGMTYTNNLLVELCERNIPFVICGKNHNVSGILFASEGHYLQAKRYDAQIKCSQELKDNLWASVIKAKLRWQSEALKAVGVPFIPVSSLISKIQEGDKTNIEALAAKRYWHLLFGKSFRRDKNLNDINSLLNYGYSILRSTTARAVVSVGLHPTLGIHHKNEGNPMRLVDDLMEPYRPIVDLKVWALVQDGQDNITPDTKKQLASLVFIDLIWSDGTSPLNVSLQKTAQSLTLSYLNCQNKLELPDIFPLQNISTNL